MQRGKLVCRANGAWSDDERSRAVEALVQRVTMLATPDGEWVFEGTPEFHAALGDPDPDYDAALFAVKNLGFISMETMGETVIEITLHPRNVELPALLAVQHQLHSSRVQLFRLKYFDTAWNSEIVYSPERAISRLSDLCSRPVAPPQSQKYQVDPQDYSLLFQTNDNPLRLMIQKWRMSFGYFDSSVISFVIKHQLLSRTVVVGVKPRKSEPVFRFIGEGHENWLDREQQFQIIGEKVQNLPDKEYGGWVSEFYRGVAATGEPRYDLVTAAIQNSPKPYLTRYERLLLPWKMNSSDEILVTLWSRTLCSGIGIPPTSGLGATSSVARKAARSS